MEKIILYNFEKDKLFDYLKENTQYIKELNRYPESYEKIKKEIKEKYNLRMTDKVSSVIDDIELVSSIISSIN